MINWKKANRYLSIFCLLGAIAYVAYKKIPERHPSLDRTELEGCWHSKEAPYFRCFEECFDKSGGYYRKGIALNPPGGVGEIVGTYSINGKNSVETEFFANNRLTGQSDNVLTRESELRVIKDDKLFHFHGKSGALYDHPLERSTEEKNCGKHWVTLKKPEGWSIDSMDFNRI